MSAYVNQTRLCLSCPTVKSLVVKIGFESTYELPTTIKVFEYVQKLMPGNATTLIPLMNLFKFKFLKFLNIDIQRPNFLIIEIFSVLLKDVRLSCGRCLYARCRHAPVSGAAQSASLAQHG